MHCNGLESGVAPCLVPETFHSSFPVWSNLYSNPCNLPVFSSFCARSLDLLPDPETYHWVWEKTYGTLGTIRCREEIVFFVKVIRWFCDAHLLLHISRWPPWEKASQVTMLKWSWLKRNAFGNFTCSCLLPRWDSMCWECVCMLLILTSSQRTSIVDVCLLTLFFI